MLDDQTGQIFSFVYHCISFYPYFPEKMTTITKENSLNFSY